MREWAATANAQLHVVPPLTIDNEIVSSRVIRELIFRGEVCRAASKLGRLFYLRGLVARGAGRGRGIGFPTMNFAPVPEAIPAQGVYATRAVFGGREFPSVTNIGVNPTFGGAEGLKIETHVLNTSVEAVGQTVDVRFVKRLRPEMKFNSVEDLKKQIKSDILKAHEAMDDIKPKQ